MTLTMDDLTVRLRQHPLQTAPLNLGQHVEQTTPAGTRVLISRLATTPLVVVHAALACHAFTPAEIATLDVLTAYWHHLPEVPQLEQRGASVSFVRQSGHIVVSIVASSPHLPSIVTLLRKMLTPSPIDQEAFATARDICLRQAERVAHTPSSALVTRTWNQHFTVMPALLLPGPEPSDVPLVTPHHLATALHDLLHCKTTHLIAVGDLDPDTALRHLWPLALTTDRVFNIQAPEPLPAPDRAPSVVGHPVARAAATKVRLIAPIGPCGRDDYATAASMACLILGGNFASRINATVRERLGLAYRTGTTMTGIGGQGFLSLEADVTPQLADQAMDAVAKILKDLAQQGPDDQEMHQALQFVAGNLALNVGSQLRRAACLLAWSLDGSDFDALRLAPPRLAEVTADEVRDVYRHYLQPQHFFGVVSHPSDAPLREIAGDWRWAPKSPVEQPAARPELQQPSSSGR